MCWLIRLTGSLIIIKLFQRINVIFSRDKALIYFVDFWTFSCFLMASTQGGVLWFQLRFLIIVWWLSDTFCTCIHYVLRFNCDNVHNTFTLSFGSKIHHIYCMFTWKSITRDVCSIKFSYYLFLYLAYLLACLLWKKPRL